MDDRKVSRSIRKYIFRILKDSDDKIFTQKTMTSLGKYYFQKIKTRIRGADDDLIKKEIVRYSKKRISDEEEYYLEILNQIGVKILPKTALDSVMSNYVVVENKFKDYEKKVNRKLISLKKEIDAIEAATTRIKRLSYKAALNKDLTSDFDQLNKFFIEKEKIRTYTEIIEFDKDYVLDCLKREIGLSDKTLKHNIIRKKTLAIIKEYENQDNVFLSSILHIEAAESNLSNELVLFFKAKFIPLKEKIFLLNVSKNFAHEVNGDSYDVQEDLKILPKIEVMVDSKNNEPDKYLQNLENLFENFSILTEMQNLINSHLIKGHRKEILNRCLALFKNAEYDLLVNLLPTQIEGVFYDLLVDCNTFQLFHKLDIFEKPTLRDKLDLFKETVHIDIYEYFKYYFNNLIRNVFAHGRGDAVGDNDELKILSYELLLDLNSVMFYYTHKSEFTRMRILLQRFDWARISKPEDDTEMKYSFMFETLCRQVHVSLIEYGVERYEPKQVLYWILNPTYEKIYSATFGSEDLEKARTIICDVEFWKYVNNNVVDCLSSGYDYLGINDSFENLLDRLFAYFDDDELINQIKVLKRNIKKLKKQDNEFQKEMNTI